MSRYYYPDARAILQVIFDGFGEEARDTEPFVIPVLPKEVHITRNSYRQADSWELVFEGNDFPLDPRLTRAGAAEIFLFENAGITKEQRVLDRGKAFQDVAARVPRNVIDEISLELQLAAAVDRFTLGRKPAIAGLFDGHDFMLDSGGKWVTINGQDYTDYLIKKQWPPLPNGRARRVPVGKRLDLLLTEILADADEEGRLELVVDGIKPSALPVVGKSEVRSHKRGIPIKQETSFWDVMYSLAVRHGCILFVRGLEVVLSRPQNLSELTGGKIRRMAWGHNLTQLNLTRELGKEVAPTVVVKSYDGAGKVITVDHPPGTFTKIKRRSRKAKRTGKTKTSIKKTEEYRIETVYGITDPVVLRNIARTKYDQLARPERKVRFATKDLRDFEGKPILDLASGDAFTIGFAEFNLELLANQDVSEQTKFNHLRARGFAQPVARIIAEHYTKLKFLERPMRFREGSIDYTVEDGITIEGELVDFVVIDGIRDPAARESRKAKRGVKFQGADGKAKGSAVIYSGTEGDIDNRNEGGT